jgi:hypothetical protein
MAEEFSNDWKTFLRTFSAGFFMKHYPVAAKRRLGRAGVVARRRADEMIKARIYEPNAESTLKAKAPKTLPLVVHGDLRGSIRSSVEVDKATLKLVLGANRREMGVNIAAVLHEGVREPGAQTFGVWRIPPREYLSTPLHDKETVKGMRLELRQIIPDVIKMGRGL